MSEHFNRHINHLTRWFAQKLEKDEVDDEHSDDENLAIGGNGRIRLILTFAFPT